MRPGLGRTRRWLRTSRAAFRRVLLAVLCIAGLGSGLVRVSGAQEPNPFVGTWRANLSRSEQPPNHIREGTTLEVVVDGDMLNLLTRAPGQDAMGQTLRVDGEYAPGDSGITFTTVRPGPDVGTMRSSSWPCCRRGPNHTTFPPWPWLSSMLGWINGMRRSP